MTDSSDLINYTELSEEEKQLLIIELRNRRPKDAKQLANYYEEIDEFSLSQKEINKAFKASISENALFYKAGSIISQNKSLNLDQLKKKLRNEKNNKLPKPSYFWTEKQNGSESFNPKRMGDFILQFCHTFCLREDEELYIYEDGKYIKGGESEIKSIVNGLLQDNYHSSHKGQTISYMKDRLKSSSELNKQDHINLKNGRLYTKGSKRTIKQHTPEVYDTYKLPVNYDIRASCPRFRQFLDQVTKDYIDFLTIQEMMGACLLKNYKYQKAFLLLGDGSNGKSTLLNVIENLVGEENISSTTLQDIAGNTYSSANLHNKLVNLGGETNVDSINKTEKFKRVTGGDTITAENKFEKQFQFKNYSTLIFAANRLPEIKQQVGRAFWRRWIPIEFPYNFTDDPTDGKKNKDPNLSNKLADEEELSGILNFALEGLYRLEKNNYTFTKSLKFNEVKDFWYSFSDPKSRFFVEKIKRSPNSHELKDDVYQAYKKYCLKINEPIEAKNEFGKFLNRQKGLKSSQIRKNGKKVSIYRGIKFK